MVDNGQTVSANPPMYKCVQLQSQQRTETHRRIKTVLFIDERSHDKRTTHSFILWTRGYNSRII